MIKMVEAGTKSRPKTEVKRLVKILRAAVGDKQASHPDSRTKMLEELRKAFKAGRAQIEADLLNGGRGSVCARKLAQQMDAILTALFQFAQTYIMPNYNSSGSERLVVVAVGGYGRGTLAPGSDIDLLFIHPHKQTPWGEKLTEYILYFLWDLGLKVGHAVRSEAQTIKMAKQDMTIRTATLEARFICGDKTLFERVMSRFAKDVVRHSGAEFISAKMGERQERHIRAGDARYVVEPDVKDGKGGLRDLQTLFWIAKYTYKLKADVELVHKGIFSKSEFNRFKKAENFLWVIRCHLHFLTKRADDRLSFETQTELAHRLGYEDRSGLRAVEHFMKHYFSVAKDVGDLTRIFCVSLEVANKKNKDFLGQTLTSLAYLGRLRGEKDFIVRNGRLDVANDKVFEKDPVNLIRMFVIAGRKDILFHPDALKIMTRNLWLIDKDVQNDRRANRYFLEILTSPQTVERILRRMNEAGVLGRFVREFGKIVALMQFNMYHTYTVDEHLIRAVGVLASLVQGKYEKSMPITFQLLPDVADIKILYVALFLHDIAKGRPEDHSIAGEKVARRLCPRFGLDAAQTDTVAWLIRHHLLMSEVAQSRDIMDPKTVEDFAATVQSLTRLRLLLILTMCDIRAVGPTTWTGWKGQLLRSLYNETATYLSVGQTGVPTSQRIAQAQKALRDKLDWDDSEIDTYVGLLGSAYWSRTETERQMAHAKLVRRAHNEGLGFVGSCTPNKFEAMTSLYIYAQDNPNLLSMIAGACALSNVNIAGAQVHTMTNGMALDSFLLSRKFDQDEDEELNAKRLIETVQVLLQGRRQLPKNLGYSSRRDKQVKPFDRPTEINIDNNLSKKYTVIEASGRDRTGLLYDLTRAMTDLSLTVVSAHIATYGEHAMDVFYVTDLTHMKIIDKARRKRIKTKLAQLFQHQ